MMTKTVSITKRRTEKAHLDRNSALEIFILEAPKLGLTKAWLVGSMAKGNDHSLSDVDLCVKGNFSLKQLYSLRDKVYLQTGVIIQLILDPPRKPRVKVYG